ncbi:MAG: hypothetical protein ABF243_03200, partial [Celeribacter marinus]
CHSSHHEGGTAQIGGFQGIGGVGEGHGVSFCIRVPVSPCAVVLTNAFATWRRSGGVMDWGRWSDLVPDLV